MIAVGTRNNPANIDATARERIDAVTKLLGGYASQGVFRGFSGPSMRGSKAIYRAAWHRGQTFEIAFDAPGHTIRFAQVLPDVPSNSAMYRELKSFVDSRHAGDLPEHRRIDRDKASARVQNRKGAVSLALEALDGDDLYAARKIVHLVNEIYLSFLIEGNYYEYMVETFDLDPDRM